jgi:hypothetical protein
MKGKIVQTFEIFEVGKIIISVDYWKSNSSGGTVSEPEDKSSEKSSTDGRDSLVKKYGEDKTGEIIKFFDDLFKDLKETTFEKYPGSVFFYTLGGDGSKKVWMQQDGKNECLWCRWNGFWSFFENEMGLNYSEIKSLVKTMVEQHLNCQVGTPESILPLPLEAVEQHLNCQV